jgi:hypothetical protein
MHEFLQKVITPDSTGIYAGGVHYIQSHFGTPGLIAAAVLSISIGALVVLKLLKIAFDVLRFVVIPSVVVTFIATYFLPYSFVYILPVSVALFSVVLIIKS